MNTRDRIILITPVCLAVVLMLIFGLVVKYQLFGPPNNFTPFCEICNTGLIREPANTWSNLGFIIAGISMAWLLAKKKFDNNNSLTRKLFYALFFPCLVVFLGPGSMMMHATETRTGGFFDMLSMYLLASFISSYAMQRYFGLSKVQFALSFLVVLAICIWANFTTCHIVFDFFGNTAFAFFLSIGILFEALNIYVKHSNVQVKWAWFALATLLLSFLVWNISQTGSPLCNPGSLLQGHAIWHLGDALAAFFLFRYYVSENVSSQ